MRRFLCIVRKWDGMTVLQLRDELGRRGLTRAGTKAELIARLISSDEGTYQPKKGKKGQPPPEEELPEPHLNFLSKELLLAEIKWRAPKDESTPSNTKKQLLETLQQLIAKERTEVRRIKDVRSLLQRLNMESDSVTLEELLGVLNGVINIETIPQNDFNVLVHNENQSFFKLWNLVYSSADRLDPAALVTVLRAMSFFRFVLKKYFSSGDVKLDVQGLTSICSRAVALQRQMTLAQITSVVEALKSLSQVKSVSVAIAALQKNLIARLDSDQTTMSAQKSTVLFSLFECLPPKSYPVKQEAVGGIISRLLENSQQKLTSDMTLRTLEKLHELQAPVPRPLLLSISALPRSVLSRIGASKASHLLSTMAKSKCLTRNNFRTLIEEYMKIVKTLCDEGYAHYIMTSQYLYSRILMSEGFLDARSTLTLCRYFGQHFENDRLIYLANRTLQKASKSFIQYERDLLDQTLGVLLPTTAEVPLYSYQLLSFTFFDRKARKELCLQLAACLLRLKSSGSGLLAYLSSPLCTKLPMPFNWSSMPRKDALLCFKAIGKFYKEIPDYPSAVLSLFKQVESSSPTFEELFYAARFCDFDVTAADMDVFSMQKYIRQGVLRSVQNASDAQNVEYVLPILYKLNVELEGNADIRAVVLSQVVPRLNFRSLHGALLCYNTLYALQSLRNPQLVLPGIANLAFAPTEADIDIDDARALFVALSQLHVSYPLPLPALVSFVSRFSPHLDEQTMSSSLPLLEPLKVHLDPVAQLLLRSLKPDVVFESLERLSAERVYKPSTLHHFLQVLEAATQRSSVLQTVDSVLEYTSVVGNSASALKQLTEKIDKFELWNELSLRALANLLLLYLENKQKNAVPKRLIQLFAQKVADNRESEENELRKNPINGIDCYAPFNHSSVLEPREITSDARENFQAHITAEQSVKEWGDTDTEQKLNAVLNGFDLAKISALQRGVACTKPRRAADSHQEEFSNLYSKRNSAQRLKAQYLDKETGWIIDLADPTARLAVLFHEKDELVTTQEKKEASTTLVAKVVKDQLKDRGWVVVGVKKDVWSIMSQEDKMQLVRHIGNKISQ